MNDVQMYAYYSGNVLCVYEGEKRVQSNVSIIQYV